MRPTRQRLTVFAALIPAAVGGLAQEPQLPAGNWQSASSATYTNAALTGAELYLNIDVAKDGSFRGEWGQYFCTSHPGAYGTGIWSCGRIGSHRVSGRFGPGRQSVIDLETLGRSAFSWAAPSVDELAIDLPQHWQGTDAILYRARLTRDGKGKPTTAPGPARDEGPLLSANALYREFNKDSRAALGRYSGQALVLEGRRGALIPLSDGGAAIHIGDGFTSRALVLFFRDLKDVHGIGEGARFRFRCAVANFDYQYVQMENCSIVP
jgi:hypothetical protein